MVESIPTLAQVVGRNVHRLRGTYTLDDVAAHGRTLGASWSSGSVSAIERGSFKVTVETLALLALALDRVRGAKTLGGEITLHDLLDTNGGIDLGFKNLTSSTPDLLAFLSGKPSGYVLDMKRAVKRANELLHDQVSELEGMNLPSDLLAFHERIEAASPETRTEVRLAEKIDVHPYELRAWAIELWGKTFEQKRDEIAGAGATAQKKGRVSRELLTEVEKAMSQASNGVD